MTGELRIVESRVDALTMAYRVAFDEEVTAHLKEQREVTKQHGIAPVRVRWLWGDLRFSRSHTWNVGNAFYRAHIDPKATGGIELPDGSREPGWTVVLTFAAQALAEMTDVGEAVRIGKAFACSLGALHEQRVRRFDLAADVAGWAIDLDDANHVLKHPHAGMKQHGLDGEELSVSPDVHVRRRISGITICPGGDLLSRWYDKPQELSKVPEKMALESERWRRRGWDGVSPVARVEFQIRGEAVKEFGCRDPEAWIDPVLRRAPFDASFGEYQRIPLEEVIDPIWQKCIRWVRLIKHDASRPSRCSNDPRWDILKSVRFRRDASMALRKRYRGGASVEQSLGCALSLLGARSMLQDQPLYSFGPDGEIEASVRSYVESIYREAGAITVDHLVEKWGASKAWEHIANVSNAVKERFEAEVPRQMAIAAGLGG